MKTRITLLITMLILTAGSRLTAQNPNEGFTTDGMTLGIATEKKFDQAVQNYIMGLKSDNDGLVESSLYYATRLRIAYPGEDLNALETTIDGLVTRGRTPSIRYMAYLASTLYASPSLVNREDLERTPNITSFFASVSEQLQSRLIVRSNL